MNKDSGIAFFLWGEGGGGGGLGVWAVGPPFYNSNKPVLGKNTVEYRGSSNTVLREAPFA